MNGPDGDRNDQRRSLIITNIRDPYFRKHFRMDRVCFQRLVDVIQHHRIATGDLKRMRTPTVEATVMGLWIMFNPDTFRSTGLNFDADMKTVHWHYKNLTRVVCEIGHQYIKWPNPMQRQRTATFYERNFGFPGIVGSIDGTLVKITAPRRQKQRYVDKNHNYSINVMIVSDQQRLIRDIYIGEPGSVNDARVFRRSPLSKCLFSRPEMLDPDQHLIGDKIYNLTDKIIVPYRDDGHLTPSHRNFNYVHSQCRTTVERLNSLLKLRMSRLQRLHCKSVETTICHIGAAAVLHNFVLLEGLEMAGMVFEGAVPAINVIEAIEAARPAGYRKRQFIRDFLDQHADDDNDD